MNTTEVLLTINSVLLTFIGFLFLSIGYFLKSLHKDFKVMVDKVNHVHTEFNEHLNVFEQLTRLFKKQIGGLKKRLKEIEKIILKK